MKFYKIQALYVPSFKNKPSEKYLIKIIGTEKALEVLSLVLVTYTQTQTDTIKQVKRKQLGLMIISVKMKSKLLQLEKNGHLNPT